jgi:hypothetical protein
MSNFGENIVEIKKEFTDYLIEIMTPMMYEGFKNMYRTAIKEEKKFVIRQRENPEVLNPGVLKIFQKILLDVPNLNNHTIEEETARIKESGKCSDHFDELVKAVIKSHIVLLAYNSSDKKCCLVNEKLHDNINVKTFVHKCYIEAANRFYQNPYLFWDGFDSLNRKKNESDAQYIIAKSIKVAITKMLPMRLILQEYLNKEYIDATNNNKFKSLVMRSDSHGYTESQNSVTNRVLESSDEDEDEENNIAQNIIETKEKSEKLDISGDQMQDLVQPQIIPEAQEVPKSEGHKLVQINIPNTRGIGSKLLNDLKRQPDPVPGQAPPAATVVPTQIPDTNPDVKIDIVNKMIPENK